MKTNLVGQASLYIIQLSLRTGQRILQFVNKLVILLTLYL
jgi:hypothetical protein